MSQQGIPPFRPTVRPPTPRGRGWWIATAILHATCAALFAVGVWGCVHWLLRVNTAAYVRAHQNAADLMPLYELFVVALAVVCVLAVAYNVVGLCLTLRGRQAGPAMLMIGAIPALAVGAGSVSEVGADGALVPVLGSGMIAVVAASMIVGWVASTRPQRPPRQRRSPVATPPPYAGGSPYLRPPSS